MDHHKNAHSDNDCTDAGSCRSYHDLTEIWGRKFPVLDQTFFFLFFYKIPDMIFAISLIIILLKGMEQIIIKVSCAGVLQGWYLTGASSSCFSVFCLPVKVSACFAQLDIFSFESSTSCPRNAPPSTISAPGQYFSRSSRLFPNPLPPLVTKGMIFLSCFPDPIYNSNLIFLVFRTL